MQYNSAKTTLVLPTSPPLTTYLLHQILTSLDILAFYSFSYDFIHSRASIDSIDRWFRRSVIVNPALEKRRSRSAAIAGIERILRAILERLGKSLFCFSSIHHMRTSSKSWCCGSRQYRVYSSRVAADILYIISIKSILEQYSKLLTLLPVSPSSRQWIDLVKCG